MNGIHTVSNSAKRIICHPVCPPGTPGRILSKRLRITYSYSTSQAAAVAAEAILSQPPTNVYGNVPIPYFHFDVQQSPIKVLNTHVTGLTLLKPKPSFSPTVPLLLTSIEQGQDFLVWEYFSQLRKAGKTNLLSRAHFSALLQSLRPDKFVSFEQRHRLSHDGTPFLVPAKTLFDDFLEKIRAVLRSMSEVGYSLGLREFSHLLECARATRNKDLADKIWRLLEGRKNISPDTWCYNCYMAAVCGTEETERSLVVDEETIARRVKRGINRGDMRMKAFQIYKNMVSRGVPPNVTTINLMMLAMARLGDTDGVRGVIKNVWQVNADNLSSEASKAPSLDKDSLLYPDMHTITTIAAAFGMNLEVELAIRLVDHMARKFKIPIEITAWISLLNWAYVISRPEKKQLPSDVIQKLWKIMTSSPYNVTPTLQMWDYPIRSLIRRHMYSKAEASIDSAMVAYNDLVSTVETTEAAYHKATSQPRGIVPKDQLTKLGRDYAVAKRAEWRGRSIIRRWVELMALGRGMMTHHIQYPRTKVPALIEKYGYFYGGKVLYILDSGWAELSIGEEKEWEPLTFRRRKRPPTSLGTNWKEEDDF
ncbi:hypothetical protein RUND412_007253 [Rhizina undulata]